MKRCSCANPPGFVMQIAIGVASAVAVALVVEFWRETRARAPLPQPLAPGLTEA